MRVRKLSLARLRDEEQGAVLLMVALSLVVLIGMAVLTFDLGRGVALKRNMVNAADAGALAAARECGLANGEASAKAAAGELVGDNNGAAKVTGFKINPDPAVCSGAPNPNPAGRNTVTVTVNVPQEYFFAQIFGFDSGIVAATATAEWTPGVSNPAPLKLNIGDVQDCDAGIDCYFEFESPGPGSEWGWLDFPQGWPTDSNDPDRCNSQAGGADELSEYIQQMGLEPTILQAALWKPPPTYVCDAGGVPNRLVDEMRDFLKAHPGVVVDFPVVACDGTALPCYPWINARGRDAYPVVGFAGYSVVDAWSHQDALDNPNCQFEGNGGQGNGGQGNGGQGNGGQGNGDPGQPASVFCIQLRVAPPGTPHLHNASLVRLVA